MSTGLQSKPSRAVYGPLVEGARVEGYWFDRSQEYAARRRREDFGRLHYATPETLTLSPLPCWKDLPVETQRKLAANLVAEIESEAAAPAIKMIAERTIPATMPEGTLQAG